MNYFLCDSPTLESGFARVTQNLLPRFNLEHKHVWALGYNGEAHNYEGINLYPANVNNSWESPDRINAFFNWLNSFRDNNKVLWTLHDPFRLRRFAAGFQQFKKQGGKIISYIPVDSHLEPEDTDFLQFVDIAVAYTNYGKKEINKIIPDLPVFVIGHGYDPEFQPIPEEVDVRERIFEGMGDKCLIGVVNSNTERKALHRSIQVLSELRKISDIYIMYIHCSLHGYYDLKRLARNLDVEDAIIFGDQFFEGAAIGKSSCNKQLLTAMYNAFDLFLSTSYGEGWGLTVAEAATCGTPICIPDSTVFPEIYGEDSAVWLPTGGQTAISAGKIVPDINPKIAARAIDKYVSEEFFLDDKRINAREDVLKHNWDEIGILWNTLFQRL